MALKSRQRSVKKKEKEERKKYPVHLEEYIVGRFKKCEEG
jgi:hypothetical protein